MTIYRISGVIQALRTVGTEIREAFGRTLSGFQVTRHKLVDMATQVEVAREFNYRVASRMEAGKAAVKRTP